MMPLAKITPKNYTPGVRNEGYMLGLPTKKPEAASFVVSNMVSVELANIYSPGKGNPYGYDFPGGAQIYVSRLPPLWISNVVGGIVSQGWPVDWSAGKRRLSGSTHLGVTIPETMVVTSMTCRTFPLGGVGATIRISTNGYQGIVLTRSEAASKPVHIEISNISGSVIMDYANIGVAAQQIGTVSSPLFPPRGRTGPNPNASPSMHTNYSIVAPGDPRINHSPADWTSLARVTPKDWNRDQSGELMFRPDDTTYPWCENNDLDQFFEESGYHVANGLIQSIAEIGIVSTGFDDPAHMWTSLKLYGDGNRDRLVPNSEDYMILDHLAHTNDNARVRLNFNSSKESSPPGTPDQVAGGIFRSLFHNVAIPTRSDLKDEKDRMCLHDFHAGLPYACGSNLIDIAQSRGPYRSIGHLLQIISNGLSSATSLVSPVTNRSAIQNTDWKREAPLRGVVGHMTFRGEQFSIVGLGQAVQVARGRTNVLGESMIEMVVERTPLIGGAQPVYFRPLYCRYLFE